MVGSRKGASLSWASAQLGLVQGVERVAEMDEHQVALVAQQRHDTAAAGGGILPVLQRGYRFVDDSLTRHRGLFIPLGPPHAEHLVQHAPTHQRSTRCLPDATTEAAGSTLIHHHKRFARTSKSSFPSFGRELGPNESHLLPTTP